MLKEEVPSSSSTVNLRLFQVFENERYSLVSKWSSKSLFPNDRHPITTIDDLDGFKDINEANDALLMEGLFIYHSIYIQIVVSNK
jgi:hypothetical protein